QVLSTCYRECPANVRRVHGILRRLQVLSAWSLRQGSPLRFSTQRGVLPHRTLVQQMGCRVHVRRQVQPPAPVRRRARRSRCVAPAHPRRRGTGGFPRCRSSSGAAVRSQAART
ncbi:unnamed protein product, partial [Scytosiphon promiscuus]